MSQPLTIEHLTRENQRAALHLRINMIPVYLLAIPVGLGLLAEEYLHRPDVVFICDNKYVVIELQQRVGLWHEHLLSTPDA